MKVVKMALTLKDKFQGVISGALFGDSFGALFEGTSLILPYKECNDIINFKLNKGENFTYTDDTTMTYSICKSLIAEKAYNAKHMAQIFTEDFFAEPNRGFGADIGNVFKKLKASNYAKPYEPASEQFNGSGSYGNGGAMRISPIALFSYNKSEEDRQALVDKVTRLTHSHWQAIVGAQLQCSAVAHLLHDTSPDNLLSPLIDEVEGLERNYTIKPDETTYSTQLKLVGQLLNEKFDPKKIVKELGHEVLAIRSVPTALYAFLRSQQDVPGIGQKTAMLRCLFLCIHLGGDVDTIASMACAMMGAHLGISQIPEQMRQQCEGFSQAIKYADELYQMVDSA